LQENFGYFAENERFSTEKGLHFLCGALLMRCPIEFGPWAWTQYAIPWSLIRHRTSGMIWWCENFSSTVRLILTYYVCILCFRELF